MYYILSKGKTHRSGRRKRHVENGAKSENSLGTGTPGCIKGTRAL